MLISKFVLFLLEINQKESRLLKRGNKKMEYTIQCVSIENDGSKLIKKWKNQPIPLKEKDNFKAPWFVFSLIVFNKESKSRFSIPINDIDIVSNENKIKAEIKQILRNQ